MKDLIGVMANKYTLILRNRRY